MLRFFLFVITALLTGFAALLFALSLIRKYNGHKKQRGRGSSAMNDSEDQDADADLSDLDNR